VVAFPLLVAGGAAKVVILAASVITVLGLGQLRKQRTVRLFDLLPAAPVVSTVLTAHAKRLLRRRGDWRCHTGIRHLCRRTL